MSFSTLWSPCACTPCTRHCSARSMPSLPPEMAFNKTPLCKEPNQPQNLFLSSFFFLPWPQHSPPSGCETALLYQLVGREVEQVTAEPLPAQAEIHRQTRGAGRAVRETFPAPEPFPAQTANPPHHGTEVGSQPLPRDASVIERHPNN